MPTQVSILRFFNGRQSPSMEDIVVVPGGVSIHRVQRYEVVYNELAKAEELRVWIQGACYNPWKFPAAEGRLVQVRDQWYEYEAITEPAAAFDSDEVIQRCGRHVDCYAISSDALAGVPMCARHYKECTWVQV